MTTKITEGLTYQQYDALPGLRWGILSAILDSPAHFRARQAQTKKDTESMRFGRLVHQSILEPTGRAPPLWIGGDKRKAAKEWAAFKSTLNSDGDYATPGELERLVGIDAALVASGISGDLRGQTEASLQWHEGSILCKARVDLITKDGILIDLKSTRDASSRDFCKTAIHMRYLEQLAFYARGLRANGIDAKGQALLAIETEAPFAHCLYAIGADDLVYGNTRVTQALAEYLACCESNDWPPPRTRDWFQMPRWADWQDENDVTTFDLKIG